MGDRRIDDRNRISYERKNSLKFDFISISHSSLLQSLDSSGDIEQYITAKIPLRSSGLHCPAEISWTVWSGLVAGPAKPSHIFN